MDHYLQDIILPYFSGFFNQDVDMALFSITGIALATTKKSESMLGLNLDEIIGRSYKDIDTSIVNKICKMEDYKPQIILDLFKKLDKLNEIVVKEQRVINYIDILPYKNMYNASLVTHMPIFNPNTGKVVATQTIGTNFHLYGMIDYLNKLSEEQDLHTLSTLPLPLHISPRQHEVLFLLLVGLSQSEIAGVLDITRGTVSAIITHQLSHKLGSTTSSTQELIDKALKLGLEKCIPQSLNEPRIIVLDNDIRHRYFTSK